MTNRFCKECGHRLAPWNKTPYCSRQAKCRAAGQLWWKRKQRGQVGLMHDPGQSPISKYVQPGGSTSQEDIEKHGEARA